MENAVMCREEDIRLEGLALKARAIVSNVGNSMLELGRVLLEAKELVPHGEWQSWVSANTGMSIRSAQNWIGAYSRYGAKAEIEGLSKTQVWGLLALPEGSEDRFLAENNVKDMTTREINEAVAKVRAEKDSEIERLKQIARDEKERMINELGNNTAEEMREKDALIQNYKNEIEVMKQHTLEILDDKNAASAALGKAEREAKDYERMLAEAQEESDRIKKELLDMKSKQAQGDGKREIMETMTATEFARIVKGFMASVSQMPYMGAVFAGMSVNEAHVYESYLETVADWCRRTEKAMGTVSGTMVEEGA